MYEESSITLADTGVGYAKYLYYSIASLIAGISLLILTRINDIRKFNRFIKSKELDNYIFQIKKLIESVLNESIHIQYKLDIIRYITYIFRCKLDIFKYKYFIL